MTSRKNYLTTLLIAGASAAAIAAAPVATAAPAGPACVPVPQSAGQCEPLASTHHDATQPELSERVRSPFYGSIGPFGTLRDHRAEAIGGGH